VLVEWLSYQWEGVRLRSTRMERENPTSRAKCVREMGRTARGGRLSRFLRGVPPPPPWSIGIYDLEEIREKIYGLQSLRGKILSPVDLAGGLGRSWFMPRSTQPASPS
jgi:hypothetical protein